MGDRHRGPAGQQQLVDQQPPDAAVAVDIGMDRQELGVRDSRMQHRMHVDPPGEPHQVVHQHRNLPMGRPLERRHSPSAPDPHRAVAPRPPVARLDLRVGGEQFAVQAMEPVRRHDVAAVVRRQGGRNVRCHQFGVGGIRAGIVVAEVGELDGELLGRGRDVLDLRRSHRVGADQHCAQMTEHSRRLAAAGVQPGRRLQRGSDRIRCRVIQSRHRDAGNLGRHGLGDIDGRRGLFVPVPPQFVGNGHDLRLRSRPRTHRGLLYSLVSLYYRESLRYIDLPFNT